MNFQTNFESSPNPKIVQWVINHSGGLIQEKGQAQVVLVIFIIVATLLSYYFFNSTGSEVEIKAPPGETMIYPENAPPRLLK